MCLCAYEGAKKLEAYIFSVRTEVRKREEVAGGTFPQARVALITDSENWDIHTELMAQDRDKQTLGKSNCSQRQSTPNSLPNLEKQTSIGSKFEFFLHLGFAALQVPCQHVCHIK